MYGRIRPYSYGLYGFEPYRIPSRCERRLEARRYGIRDPYVRTRMDRIYGYGGHPYSRATRAPLQVANLASLTTSTTPFNVSTGSEYLFASTHVLNFGLQLGTVASIRDAWSLRETSETSSTRYNIRMKGLRTRDDAQNSGAVGIGSARLDTRPFSLEEGRLYPGAGALGWPSRTMNACVRTVCNVLDFVVLTVLSTLRRCSPARGSDHLRTTSARVKRRLDVMYSSCATSASTSS